LHQQLNLVNKNTTTECTAAVDDPAHGRPLKMLNMQAATESCSGKLNALAFVYFFCRFRSEYHKKINKEFLAQSTGDMARERDGGGPRQRTVLWPWQACPP
jgi:hypothetical protein